MVGENENENDQVIRDGETEDLATDFAKLRSKLGGKIPAKGPIAGLPPIQDSMESPKQDAASVSKAEPAGAETAPLAGAGGAEAVEGAGTEAAEEETQVYLKDEEPTGESNWVKWMLMHGTMEEDLVNIHGKNQGTVRICAQELERDGYRKRPPKPAKGGSLVTTGRGGQRGMRIFAQGGPPEELIESISMPIDGPQARIFENGLKAGALLIITGIRAAQELSSVAIQQVKPIIDMSKTMREGEAIAAKSAASEAAQEAAMKVSSVFAPAISNLEGAIAGIRSGGGSDPMQTMMVRAVEPMIQQMMRMFMPQLQYGQSQDQGSWKVVQE